MAKHILNACDCEMRRCKQDVKLKKNVDAMKQLKAILDDPHLEDEHLCNFVRLNPPNTTSKGIKRANYAGTQVYQKVSSLSTSEAEVPVKRMDWREFKCFLRQTRDASFEEAKELWDEYKSNIEVERDFLGRIKDEELQLDIPLGLIKRVKVSQVQEKGTNEESKMLKNLTSNDYDHLVGEKMQGYHGIISRTSNKLFQV